MTFDYGVVFFEEFVDGIVDPYSFTIGNHYAVELFVISMLIHKPILDFRLFLPSFLTSNSH